MAAGPERSAMDLARRARERAEPSGRAISGAVRTGRKAAQGVNRPAERRHRTRIVRRAARSAGFIIDEGGRGRLGTDARASGMPLPEVGRDQNHAPAGGLSGAAPAAQRRAREWSLRSERRGLAQGGRAAAGGACSRNGKVRTKEAAACRSKLTEIWRRPTLPPKAGRAQRRRERVSARPACARPWGVGGIG